MDLNHDKQIQSLLCYRYTIGQTNDFKVGVPEPESRPLSVRKLDKPIKRLMDEEINASPGPTLLTVNP